MSTLAPQIYGADEINAIVLDPGTYSTRVGYAGTDSPTLVLPSSYGERPKEDAEGEVVRVYDENSLFATPQPNLAIKPIVQRDLIVDWDAAAGQYDYMFKRMQVDPHEQPLLFTEATMNGYKSKVRALQVFLEEQEFCGFYAVKQPTCVSFAHGRPNCLIVDVGHDLVTVTPVIDGICLKKQVLGTRYGGAFLDQQLTQLLEERQIEYHPVYTVKTKAAAFWEKGAGSRAQYQARVFDYDVDSSVTRFHRLRTLQEMKETLLECSAEDGERPGDEDPLYFELPDGLNVPFSAAERQRLANTLFNPLETLSAAPISGWETPHNGNIIADLGTANDKSSKEYIPLRRSKKPDEDRSKKAEAAKAAFRKEKETRGMGLSRLVQTVLEQLDVDLKPQLANNIVLTGATSLIPRLNERLHKELTLRNPSLKIRIHSVGNTSERKYSSWIGGSILASLGTFHQLWVSREEYDEVGADRLIVSRFR